ncbi:MULTISPECIES: hypothetical protein [Myxococcus]|uniref:hypothetical protein n=1 Tax=Myxococcus TaxID=32 RepID=UPI0013D5CD2B|nr:MULTISPECIES: hypothetical protein [Myxococcus]NVJ27205.1 hypothetical protein [Myxococcus sp. AM011]
MRDVAQSPLSLQMSRGSAAELVRSILPILYGVDERSPRAAATKHYHPEATFQDPFIAVQGVERIRRVIYVGRALLSGCRIEFGDVAETVRPDGSHVVLADVTCTLVFKHFLAWRPWQLLVGDSFTYRAVHKLVLDEDLKITSHEEHLSVRSVLEAVPVVRALYALMVKTGSSGCTSDSGYTLNQYIAGDRTIRTVL